MFDTSLTRRISQLELKQCIESLTEELKKVSESQQTTVDLDAYVKKLINAKHRVTVLSNILQNAQVFDISFYLMYNLI